MSSIKARKAARSASTKAARSASSKSAALQREIEKRCKAAKGYTVTLQCRDFGEKAWSTLRTLTAATMREKLANYENLLLQRDRWAISGVLGEQQYRIQFS